jgi:hypothetical protein
VYEVRFPTTAILSIKAPMTPRVYAKRTKKADVDAAALIGTLTQGVL